QYTLPAITDASTSCTDNTWMTTATGVPDARQNHTAVWTGSEMIVWGGLNSASYLNTGSRYNPSTDTWTATSTANSPSARYQHTAVWTGSEMIVWGGAHNSSEINSGGGYGASDDRWAA